MGQFVTTILTFPIHLILMFNLCDKTVIKHFQDFWVNLFTWEQQWQAQLKKAEADAPIDPRTKKQNIYIKFDCYVRAKVWRGLGIFV